jgi:FKBP-type peptidyl-prolyl cis-trans isomerase
VDLKVPPSDATKTESGLLYKKLVSHASGKRPARGDTALVQYTGWLQSTGATFFTTRGRDQPIGIDLAHAAPGFGEALQLLRAGERMVVWIPASHEVHQPLVYEIEVVDVVPVTSRS